MVKSSRRRTATIAVCLFAAANLGWYGMASQGKREDRANGHAPPLTSEGEALRETTPGDRSAVTEEITGPAAEPLKHQTEAVPRPGSRAGALLVGARERHYLLHVPTNYEHGKPAPLLLAFHGRLGTGKLMEQMTRFSEIADCYGFIVAYPEGIGRSWNAGHGVGLAESEGVDDVQFIDRLIGALSQEFSIDQQRIYAAGMSNGGMFAYRLACELKGRLAAVASVAGPLPPDVAEDCDKTTGPISVLHIQGTADPIVPWNGGETTTGGKILSADSTIEVWMHADNCSTEGDVTLKRGRVLCQSYRQCARGAEVSLCRIEGGGHTWPGSATSPAWQSTLGETNEDLNASEFIWEFFARHSLSVPHGSLCAEDNAGQVSQAAPFKLTDSERVRQKDSECVDDTSPSAPSKCSDSARIHAKEPEPVSSLDETD